MKAKTKKRTKRVSSSYKEMLIDKLTASEITPDEVSALLPENPGTARNIIKTAMRERRAAETATTLVGKVVAETEKAILFKQTEDTCEAWCGESWWPKSQVSLMSDMTLRHEDSLTVPNWLLEKKRI